MARSVFTGITSTGLALALTAAMATPSMAMSFSAYSPSAAPVGSRADVNDLFSGRLLSADNKRAREIQQLQEIRRNQGNGDGVRGLPTSVNSNRSLNLNLTLPFYPAQ